MKKLRTLVTCSGQRREMCNLKMKGGDSMAAEEQKYLFVEDVMELLHTSRSNAYKIIKTLNEELQAKGYYITRGRVSRVYFEERNHI